MKNNKIESQKGVAVLVSILLIAVLLSIILTISSILVPKIKVANQVKNSSAAIYAAESGIEWCIYVKNKGAGVSQPTMSNGATYANGLNNPSTPLVTSDCSLNPLRVIGSFQGVSRALEVSF